MSARTIVQVYLSYCEQDKDWVNKSLVPRLKDANIEIIEFEIGRPILEEIQRAIGEAKFILMIISKSYLEDSWGKFQSLLTTTLSAKKNNWKGLPVVIEKCSLPPLFDGLVFLDLSEPNEQKWTRLLKTILGDGYELYKDEKQDDLEEINATSSENILQFNSFLERTNNLYATVVISRPYLLHIRKYSVELKQYLTKLQDEILENDEEAWNQFDKINFDNIFQELESIITSIMKGIRSKSTSQRTKYLQQTKQSISSIEESLRYLENVLMDRF